MLNNDLIYFMIIITIIFIIIIIVNHFKYNKKNINNVQRIQDGDVANEGMEENQVTSPLYSLKSFMTYNEKRLYNILLELEKIGNYKVHPQLNLASVLNKTNNSTYYNDLFRNIDFAIFDSNYNKLLLLIELNDETHNNKKRIARDIKVKNICDIAKIPLITFYTKYPNDKNYVINRVLNILNNNKSQEEDNEA